MSIARVLSRYGRLSWATAVGTDKSRNDARYELLTRLAAKSGHTLVNKHLGWPLDKAFVAYMRAFDPRYRVVKDRHFGLKGLVGCVAHIPGDTAEAGVFHGASSFIIMQELGRPHFGFDSFEGLSEPDPRDIHRIAKLHTWKAGDLRSPEDEVRKSLERFGEITLLKGWIPERFSEVADRRFCFIHIDVDLYQPTWDTLQFFYERTNPGGVLVCDDYGSLVCPGARQACDDFMLGKPERIIHLTSGQGLIIKV